MMLNSKLSLVALVCALACAPTETGNPPFTASLAFDAHSTDDNVGFDPSNAVEVQEVWIDVGPSQFVLNEECDAPETDWFANELGVEDHVTDNAVLADFMLESADYCRVSVPLRAVSTLPPGAPAQLMGNSLYVRGSANGVPFTLVGAGPYDIALSGSPLSLSEDERGVLVAFDVGVWLGGLDFSSAEQTGGEILIDASSNATLLGEFETVLASGVALYRDADVDGFLDATPPVFTAE